MGTRYRNTARKEKKERAQTELVCRLSILKQLHSSGEKKDKVAKDNGWLQGTERTEHWRVSLHSTVSPTHVHESLGTSEANRNGRRIHAYDKLGASRGRERRRSQRSDGKKSRGNDSHTLSLEPKWAILKILHTQLSRLRARSLSALLH